MGRSPKFTLSRIRAALEKFGMPPEDRLRFLQILRNEKGRIGRPPTRRPAPPESEEEARKRREQIEQLQRELDEFGRELDKAMDE